ncbi:universal stress protein [Caenimonas sedimenti]|uniref:Universal stress protein n=1 Tax=Caenimonas sedimenti TaxID=2596921 RepID=A0A562ZIV5_9BURK|nr:universal stress protein [Caenimonas sedimenti]TWO68512.1 universal stress protein [Caenimonas sedimenti]
MSTDQSFHRWVTPRHILVLHDLTAQADQAAWRAGMIARDQGADLCLLHAAREPANAGRARIALQRLAGELAERLGMTADVRVVHGDPVDAVMRARADTSMVVLGARRRNVLRDWIFGTPAERLIRMAGRPVLVVKKPATAGYRRVLVPVDLGPGATSAITAATALTRGTRIDVFHSLAVRHEVTMRAADVPEAVVREYRQRSADRARQRIGELIGTVPDAGFSAVPSIGFGYASSMVLAKEQAMRADLVVIGKRRRGMLADFFLGSVTQRVLAGARSDVLVLPVVAKEAGAPLPLSGLPA